VKGRKTIMDPNSALAAIRELTERVLNGADDRHNARALAESIESLDTWLTRGGFKPADWQHNGRAHLANALTRVNEYAFINAGTFGGIPHVTVLAADGTEMQHSIPLDEAERDYGPDSKASK
jgi:hypothetical protein